MTNIDELHNPTQVATILKVPETTLSQWRYRGIGPRWAKVGRHVRYRDSDLIRWLDDRSSGGTAA